MIKSSAYSLCFRLMSPFPFTESFSKSVPKRLNWLLSQSAYVVVKGSCREFGALYNPDENAIAPYYCGRNTFFLKKAENSLKVESTWAVSIFLVFILMRGRKSSYRRMQFRRLLANCTIAHFRLQEFL